MIPLELLLTVVLVLLSLCLVISTIAIILVLRWRKRLDEGVDDVLRGLSHV